MTDNNFKRIRISIVVLGLTLLFGLAIITITKVGVLDEAFLTALALVFLGIYAAASAVLATTISRPDGKGSIGTYFGAMLPYVLLISWPTTTPAWPQVLPWKSSSLETLACALNNAVLSYLTALAILYVPKRFSHRRRIAAVLGASIPIGLWIAQAMIVVHVRLVTATP